MKGKLRTHISKASGLYDARRNAFRGNVDNLISELKLKNKINLMVAQIKRHKFNIFMIFLYKESEMKATNLRRKPSPLTMYDVCALKSLLLMAPHDERCENREKA